MARLSVLATAVAGVLLAINAFAAPAQGPAAMVPKLCNPSVCMGLAILHSDCADGFNPGPIMSPDSVTSIPLQLAQCVCSDPKGKENYLNCYGFCTIDEASEPYCGQPVKKDATDVDYAFVDDTGEKFTNGPPPGYKCDPFTKVCKPINPPNCKGPNCDKLSPFGGVTSGFCGVYGQACYVSHDTDGNKIFTRGVPDGYKCDPFSKVCIPIHPPPCKGPACDKYDPGHLGGAHGGFYGVPGQACYIVDTDADADANVTESEHPEITAEPDSDFVDVGDVQSDELKGKVGGGAKRAVGIVNGPVPTTLQTVRPSI